LQKVKFFFKITLEIYKKMKIFLRQHEGQSGNHFSFFEEGGKDLEKFWVLGLAPKNDQNNLFFEKLAENFFSEIFNETGQNPEKRFETTLKKINENLEQDFSEISREIFDQGGIILAFFSEGVLFFSVVGHADVGLFRDRSFLEISEGIAPKKWNGELFQNIANGKIESGDKIIFSTIRLQRFFTERQLPKILEEGISESMEIISSSINKDEPGNITLLGFWLPEKLPIFDENEKSDFSKKDQKNLGSTMQVWEKFSDSFGKAKDVFYSFSSAGRQKFLAAAAIFGVVLIISLFWIFAHGDNNGNFEKYQAMIEEIQNDISTVETRRIEEKNDEANVLLDRAEKSAHEVLVAGYYRSDAAELLEIIAEKRRQVNNIMEVKNPKLTADFTEVDGNPEPIGIFFLGNELLSFSQNSIFKIPISGATIENIDNFPGDNSVVLGCNFDSKDTSIFLTKSGQVFERKDGNLIPVSTADQKWKNAKNIATYSKFLYFLDPEKNQIWKYERRDSGFTLPDAWVSTGDDLKDAVSFAIDGNIFVLKSNGEIWKFYGGKKIDYLVKNFPEEKISGEKIFTNPDLDKIFILDSEKNRILVFTKGQNESYYDRQIIFENTGKLQDIFVRDNRLFVLGENKIFEVGI